MVSLERCLASGSSAVLLALGGWCAGCADDARRALPIEASGEDVDAVGFGLSFIAADTETGCGRAAGIRIVIAHGDARESCQAGWVAASIDGPGTDGGSDHLADCLFIVPVGAWTIESIDVIGDDGAPLACCSSRYVALVEVTEAETTEVAAELLCDAPDRGSIELYGWLDRVPPDPACVRTQGYWKNHEASWPLASVTLGARVYTKAAALTLLRTAPRGNATIILAHQLIAAKLNVAAGANSRRADERVFAADELLTRTPVGSQVTGEIARIMTALAEELTAFNEGRPYSGNGATFVF